MRPTRKTVLISLVSIIALIALCFLAFPPLARHLAVQKIAEATGRKTEIAGVSFNPFTLSAGVTGFRLSEKGSNATFLSFSSVRLKLSPLSLPKRAFIVTEISLASPYLHIVRTEPNKFNFSDLITPPKKEAKKEGEYLFSLNNMTLSHGSVDFEDKALTSERDHRVRALALAIPFFSNIPYLADRYVTPHFEAVVNGTPVALNGKLKPMTRAVEASIDLKVRDLDLPFYLGYLPFPLPVRVGSGRLTSALELSYRVDAKLGPETRVAGSVVLDRIALDEPAGAPLVRLQRGELSIKNAALNSNRFDLGALDLDKMEFFLAKDAKGTWNFQKISGAKPEASAGQKPAAREKEKEPAAKGKPLLLTLGKFALTGSQVHLVDASAHGGFKSDIRDLDVNLTGLSTAAGQHAPFSLKLATARGESLALKGELVPDPLELRANLTLAGVPLKDYYPYLSDTLAAPVTGKLGVDAEIFYNGPKGLVLEKTALKGENLAAPFGGSEGVRLKEVLLRGISVDLKGKKAQVEGVELKGGNVVLSKEPGGAISATHLLKQQKPALPAASRTQARARSRAKEEAAASPFSYRIDKISGSDLGLRFTDRSREDEPVFALSRTKFALSGITGPKQGPIPFTIAAVYGSKGRISASGNVTPAPLRLKGKLQLQRIPLRDFDSYIPEGTAIFLADGTLDTNLNLNLEQASSGLRGGFAGSVGVRSFYCQETVHDEDLLKWDSLQLDRISGTLAPFSLAIRDVSLTNFYARVIVEKDGTLNLQNLTGEPASAPSAAKTGSQPAAGAAPGAAKNVASSPAPGATAAKGAPAPSTKAGAATTASAPIRIDTVALQGGTLDFTDRHLKNPFDTTFYNLGGRVSGLSSEASKAADVDLRGNLENHSPLSITGTINPLRGDLFLDLKIAFSDIELSPFSPYATTYLGYMVDKGKLNLDLIYKIDKKALTSQNKIFIDQFTFGKQVESDKATKLPVRLAIALLKDRKGEIHLDLPVAGQTDDPKFSVWKVVLQILKNLLVKAATSPFALLGSMFGGGEDFSAVPFASGSSTISKPDEAKLLKLSQLLQDRPALNLEITGFVDKEKDAEGYRNELLLKKMKGEKFRAQVKQGKTREGQTPENTELLPQESPVYLKAVYAKEKFPKPRNILGIAKDLPDAEMKKLILTHTVVGDNELHNLARERAEAVRDFLLTNGKLPPQRLFEKSADIYRPSSKEKAGGARVEFGAIMK